MKKRFVSLFLALVVLLTMLPTAVFAANSASFRDVASTAWYHDAVDYVSRKGIMLGVGNNMFSPDITLTRAQLCQILYNIEEKPRTGNSSFSDVSASAWYSSAVNWATAQGIMNETENGLFSPDSPISREQMVTILYRYATYKNYNLSAFVSLADYSDANQLSSWAEDAMKWAVSEQIISGTNTAALLPQGTTTRADAATILMRFCQRMEAKEAFYAKDIDDFSGETVINFDTSDETNFAVLVENAVSSESNGFTNQLVSADEDEGVYVFSHIDQTISSLTPGDVLYLTYGTGADDYLLLKVGSIEISGNTATVTEGKAELSDYFQYIDVDMEVDVSQTENTVARNQGHSAPTILAFAQDAQPQNWSDAVRTPSVLANSMTGSSAVDFKVGFSGDVFSLTGDVKFTLKIKISYDKTILDVEEISLSVKQETSLDGKITEKEKGDIYKQESPKVSVPLTAGINAELSTYFKFEASASATGSISIKATTENGTKFIGGKQLPIRESDSDLSTDIGGKLKISAGFGVTGKVVVAKVLTLSLSGESGVEVDGTPSVSTQSDVKHICAVCIDGAVNAYFELTFKTKLGLSEKYSLTLADIKLAKVTIKLKTFYVSFLGGSSPVEFDWGTCPHKQYLLTVTAVDQFGEKVAGARIFLSDNGTSLHPEPEGMTGADGTYRVYCDNGSYRATAYGPDGYKDTSGDVTISGKAQPITLVLEKNVVSSGIMTCDVYDDAYDYGSIIGSASMKIQSDHEATFSMKITFDPSLVYDLDSLKHLYNGYEIHFGAGNQIVDEDSFWDLARTAPFFTYVNTFRPYGGDPNGGARRYGNWADEASFTMSELTADLENDEVTWTWTITATNAGDFSFYDLEGETMVARVTCAFL